jgi:hypothetical protein
VTTTEIQGLTGRAALVSGAERGTGRAIALALRVQRLFCSNG